MNRRGFLMALGALAASKGIEIGEAAITNIPDEPAPGTVFHVPGRKIGTDLWEARAVICTGHDPALLFCEGQEVSRASYPKLFAAIGTAYGMGSTSAMFRVPDSRGRVL